MTDAVKKFLATFSCVELSHDCARKLPLETEGVWFTAEKLQYFIPDTRQYFIIIIEGVPYLFHTYNHEFDERCIINLAKFL